MKIKTNETKIMFTMVKKYYQYFLQITNYILYNKFMILTLITWSEITNFESIPFIKMLASVEVVSFHSHMFSNARTT